MEWDARQDASACSHEILDFYQHIAAIVLSDIKGSGIYTTRQKYYDTITLDTDASWLPETRSLTGGL